MYADWLIILWIKGYSDTQSPSLSIAVKTGGVTVAESAMIKRKEGQCVELTFGNTVFVGVLHKGPCYCAE